jgi:hypothetical protein
MKTTVTLPHAHVALLPFSVACNTPGYAYIYIYAYAYIYIAIQGFGGETGGKETIGETQT